MKKVSVLKKLLFLVVSLTLLQFAVLFVKDWLTIHEFTTEQIVAIANLKHQSLVQELNIEQQQIQEFYQKLKTQVLLYM